MIKKVNRHDENAYRVAVFELDPSVTELEEGQMVTLNAQGKLVIADGTQKAFVSMGSYRKGRDQVGGVPVKKIPVLVGVCILTVSNVDPAQTYVPMSPLKVTTGGILTLAKPDDDVSGDKAHKIAGYALGPLSADKYLRVVYTV